MPKLEIFTPEKDFEQRSPGWYKVRMGIPTCSQLDCVLRTKGRAADGSAKTRTTYKFKLAGELLTGVPMDSYSNYAMQRGRENEDEALDLYSLMTGNRVKRVAFLRFGRFGCSPDGLADDAEGPGLVESKDAAAHIQLERLIANELPKEHEPQCVGALAVSGCKWIDFVSHCEGLPLFRKRVYRDEKRIAEIKLAVDRFNFEIDEVVDQIRRLSA